MNTVIIIALVLIALWLLTLELRHRTLAEDSRALADAISAKVRGIGRKS